MTFTIPDFIPYLSILLMNFLKLRNWSIVCTTSSLAPMLRVLVFNAEQLSTQLFPREFITLQKVTTYRLEDRYLSSIEIVIWLDLFVIIITIQL